MAAADADDGEWCLLEVRARSVRADGEPWMVPPASTPGPTRTVRASPTGRSQTLLWSEYTGGAYLLGRHHARLSASAHALGLACPSLDELRARIDDTVHAIDGARAPQRVRVLLSKHDSGGESAQTYSLAIQCTALASEPHARFPLVDKSAAPLPVVLDPVGVSSSLPELRHKSTRRRVYDEARARAGCTRPGGAFDALLANERGELTEACIANLAIADATAKPWRTPPLACGLLSGVMRAELLAQGVLVEGVCTAAELRSIVASQRAPRRVLDDGAHGASVGHAARQYPRVYCFNSVRGVYEVSVALPGDESLRLSLADADDQ